MGLFNLLPLDDKNSKTVEIELKNDNNIIQRFDLGDINVDLGRGSRAAYIKFDNQFQVWEITGDFVDMDLDMQKWTYSNLWDLRYGRLYSPNNIPSEQENLLNFMKYALNTPIKPTAETPSSQPLKTTTLYAENGDKVSLSLYKENNKAYALLDFDKNNSNQHLKLASKYFNHKFLEIDVQQLEKIIEHL